MKDTWIILPDGAIGVYMIDQDGTPFIASGEPGNYRDYDICPRGLHPAFYAPIGSVDDFPTSADALDQVRRMREYADRCLKIASAC